MGVLWNHIKYINSDKATWKERIASYALVSGFFGAGVSCVESFHTFHNEQYYMPYRNSTILMRIDGNLGEKRNGKLEEEEVQKWLHSKRFQLDENGNLTPKGIQDVRDFVEPTKEIVPNHAKAVLDALNVLKDKANPQK